MARITQQSSIHTTGISYENEPIIKSDGAGEIMQWQPSDGAADGIFITEGGSEGDPARLGIGTSPQELIHLQHATAPHIRIERTTAATSGTLGLIEFGARSTDDNLVSILAEHDGSTTNGKLTFSTEPTGGSLTARMVIDSAGLVLVDGAATPAASGYGVDGWVAELQQLGGGGIAAVRAAADVYGGSLHLAKSRGTIASPTTAADDDAAGAIYFEAHDGTDFRSYVGAVECFLDGAVASNDTPGRLVFSTAADGANTLTERMTISSAGSVTVTGAAGSGFISYNDGVALSGYVGSGVSLSPIDFGNTDLVVRAKNDVVFVASNGTGLADKYQASISGTTGVMTVKQPGWPLKNEISNSGFDVWSNSGLSQGRTVGRQSDDFNVGSAILDNDGSAIGSWNTTTTRCTVTVSGGEFTMTNDGTSANMQTRVQLSGLTAGKLYKFSVQLENGTGTWASPGSNGSDSYLRVFNSGVSATLATVSTQTEASGMEDYSIIWEASSATDWIALSADTAASQTAKFDNVYVTEVTPGCLAADALGPDGWTKNAGADVTRMHSDGATEAVTKKGSFYAAKIVSDGSPYYELYTKQYDEPAWIAKYLGRTVTFGCWVKTDAASQAKVNIYNNGNHLSAANTGTGWEWLEVTHTVDSSVGVRFGFYVTNTKTAYISQPMLVFGSAIGAGNYSRPMGEIVWFENRVESNEFDGIRGFSDVTSYPTINLEADSNGAIPKGAKAVVIKNQLSDSGSNANTCYFATGGSMINARGGAVNDASGVPDDEPHIATGWTPLDSNGDYQYYLNATGSGTLDFYYGFSYTGVELR